MEKHCDNFFHVSVVLSGMVQETSGTVEENASALSVVTKPPDASHSNQFGPNGACVLSVKIPQTRLAAHGRPASSINKWQWIHGNSLLSKVVGLINVSASCCESSETADQFTEQMELLLDSFANVTPPMADNPPNWLFLVRDHVHDTYNESLAVSSLAENVGVTPTHLTRCFQNFYGCPVTTYRHRLRVKAAANMLADENTSLAQIALDTGFCDQSHFTHIFRRQTGKTPNAYRNLSRTFC